MSTDNKPRANTVPADKSVVEKFNLSFMVTVTRNGRTSMTKIAKELTSFLQKDLQNIAKDVEAGDITDMKVGCVHFTKIQPVPKKEKKEVVVS